MLFTGAAFAVYLVFVIFLAVPLGHYIEWVMRGGRLPVLSGLEQRLYGLLGLEGTEELTACGYLQRVLLFSLAGFLLLLLLPRQFRYGCQTRTLSSARNKIFAP